MSEAQRKVFKRIAQTGERLERPAREAGPFPDHPSVQMDDVLFVAGATLRSKWGDVEHIGPTGAAADERRRVSLGLEAAPDLPEEGSYSAQADAMIAANTTPEAKVGWLKRQMRRLGIRK